MIEISDSPKTNSLSVSTDYYLCLLSLRYPLYLSTGFPSTQLAKLETVGKARPSAPLLYEFPCLLLTTISWEYIQLKVIENLPNSGLNKFVYFSHITESPELGSCWCPFSCPMMTWTPVFRLRNQRGSFHPQVCCLWVVRGLLYLQATHPHSRQEKWERWSQLHISFIRIEKAFPEISTVYFRLGFIGQNRSHGHPYLQRELGSVEQDCQIGPDQ